MELNHKILGEGDPIIILHGLFGMLDNWQSVAKKLAEHYMVILLDLRNHGKSPHSDEWTVPLMAADVVEFMEANWIHRATIMGHSMGGKVAMEIALTHPDMVTSLIVVDIGPKQYLPGHDIIFKGLGSVPVDIIRSRGEAEEALEATISDWGVRQFLLKNISRVKEGGYRWKMNLPVIEKNYLTILEPSRDDHTYDGPTLFLRGELSDYILPDDHLLIESIFPEAEIKTINGAGHWIHADQQEALIDEVSKFLN